MAAALLFGRIVRTRWLPAFVGVGLVRLVGGSALATTVTDVSDAALAASTLLVGFGVGAAVAPALFLAGFSLRSAQTARVFAVVELLRGLAAFIAGPILLYVAQSLAGGGAPGTRAGIWISAGIAGAGAIAATAIVPAGRARLHEPRLDEWLANECPAVDSPPLGALVREAAPRR